MYLLPTGILCLLPAFLTAVLGAYTDPHCQGKQVIVHLFEWKWSDIANECERYLGKKGFCGVQVSPPNEHVVVTQPMRPWWERYQPVSYKLHSRGGTEAEFKDMVTRCKNVGVRVYVDSVVNHMAGLGRQGSGSGGTSFNSDNFDFPGVPFRREHFNSRDKCPSHDGNINNYGDPNNVRNCFLVGLTDLDQSQEYVRTKIAEFYNHCIDVGVAGFRIDAAKHMWPGDIKAIQDKTKDLPEGGRPFFYHEVIDQNDGAIKVGEYTPLGYVTEFRYCQKIAEGIRNFGMLHGVYDPGWGMTDSAHAFVFVDNHDNQRGHGGGGNLITHKHPRDYKMAVAFTLAYNYGFTRVMSSYYFQSSDQGPPHNGDYSAKDVTINADGSCGNGWVCEHRWNPIGNMVAFRNAVAGTGVDNWRNENEEVSFSRGQKGFFAMAKSGHMDRTLHTGLPAGEYCELVSDCKKKITVDGSGNAHIVIDNSAEPIIAFIVGGPTGSTGSFGGGSSGSGSQTVTSAPATPVSSVGPAPEGWARTVIMIERQTMPGQDLFIRGGIDHNHRQGCTTQASTSACAIPIKTHNLGTGSHYAQYNAWSTGDHYLDWYGIETGQQSYHGHSPSGTPAVWTTNVEGAAGFTPLNTYVVFVLVVDDDGKNVKMMTHEDGTDTNNEITRMKVTIHVRNVANGPLLTRTITYGQHYWLIDVQMDCSRTENGWFELKALVNGQWEGNINGQTCGTPPYSSQNHWAKCGFKNVFHFNSGRCQISDLS